LVFFKPLRAACDNHDAAALQAIVPGLTKKEAASLLFHHRRLCAARMSGWGHLIMAYAREIWGTVPPRVVVSGSFKLGVAALQALCVDMSPEDVRAVVSERIAGELADLAEPDEPDEPGVVKRNSFLFWRRPIDTPNLRDTNAAYALQRRRQHARREALLSYYDAPLREAHAAAVQVLEVAGLDYQMLAEWYKSGRAARGL
jgi:hypothetical protein